MQIPTKPNSPPPLDIAILAMDGVVYSSIIGPMDIFSVANVLRQSSGQQDFAHVRIVRTGRKVPMSFNGLKVETHGRIEDADKYDIIILPALMGSYGQGEDDFSMAGPPRLISWLKQQHAGGACLGSVCAGAFFLAQSGLLDGRSATTHWNLAAQFKKHFPGVHLQAQKMLVDENDLITAGGVTAYFDLALYLVRKFGSNELAAACSKLLLIDPERSSQTPYQLAQFQKKHADTAILNLQNHIEINYRQSLTLEQMEKIAGLEQRTLLRRFRLATGDSPIMYLQRIRIEMARQLLEYSRDNINEIAWKVGYEDGSSFTRLFKKLAGMTPGNYRKKFSLVVTAK